MSHVPDHEGYEDNAAPAAAKLSPDALPNAQSVYEDLMPDKSKWHERSMDSASDEGLNVPAYKLHPMDMPLIREAAGKMNMSVADFAQLAPFLCARYIPKFG